MFVDSTPLIQHDLESGEACERGDEDLCLKRGGCGRGRCAGLVLHGGSSAAQQPRVSACWRCAVLGWSSSWCSNAAALAAQSQYCMSPDGGSTLHVVVRFAQVGLLQRMARPHAHWCMCVSQACFQKLWSITQEQHFPHTDGACQGE